MSLSPVPVTRINPKSLLIVGFEIAMPLENTFVVPLPSPSTNPLVKVIGVLAVNVGLVKFPVVVPPAFGKA